MQRAGLAAIAALVLAPSAPAAVSAYQLIKEAVFTQSSDGPPTADGYAAVEAISGASSDFTGVVFSGGPSPITLTGSNGNFQASQSFASQADLDTAVPNGTTFTFTLSGGTLGGQSGSLTSFSTAQYPTSAPYLSGTSFDSLQNANASSPIDLTFNAGPLGLGIIIGTTTGGPSYANYSISGDSLVLPANTLQPGTSYEMFIFSLAGATFSGFDGAVGLMDEGDVTTLTFTTSPVPLPATVWLLLSGLGALMILGRRRKSPSVPVYARP